MATRSSSSLNMSPFGGFATIGVPTLGACLSQSWHVSSRCFCRLLLRFGVSLPTLGVGFPTSCQTSYRGSSTLHIAYFCRVEMIAVATLCVGLPASCLMTSRVFSGPDLVLCRRLTLGLGFPSLCRITSLASLR
jgi:hypothetical protein